MPRKSRTVARADADRTEGGSATVDRALALLSSFTRARPTPRLADLAHDSGLYKSTVLRLLASLEHAGLVQHRADGTYAVGSEVARLHQALLASFSLEELVMPALRALVAQTRESAAFYVPRGDRRLCLYRVDSPQPVRDHLRAGDLLPIDRGAAGRVLMAYGGADDALSQQIRHDQIIALVGHRVPELSGIAAPVFSADGGLAGAINVIMPSERFQPAHESHVRDTARAITRALGGDYPPPE